MSICRTRGGKRLGVPVSKFPRLLLLRGIELERIAAVPNQAEGSGLQRGD